MSNNTEINVLMDIYADLCRHIEYMNKTKQTLTTINNKINMLDNNYIDNKCNHSLFSNYFGMLDNYDEYEESLNDFKTLKNEIINIIKNICNHEWVEDDIDINPEASQRICYCVKCDATKK